MVATPNRWIALGGIVSSFSSEITLRLEIPGSKGKSVGEASPFLRQRFAKKNKG